MRIARLLLLLAGVGLGAVVGVAAQEVGQREGVLIVAVEPAGPAAAAGLGRGDIILSVAGVPVNSVPELAAVLEEHAGTRVPVRYRHGDDLRTSRVALGDGLDAPQLGIEPESRDLLFLLREQLRSLVPDDLELNLFSIAGVRLVTVVAEGPAAVAGLRRGDVITHIDGTPLEESETMTELITDAAPGVRMAIRFLRAGNEQETTVELGTRPDGVGAYFGVRFRPWYAGLPFQRRGQDQAPPQWPRLNIRDLLRL